MPPRKPSVISRIGILVGGWLLSGLVFSFIASTRPDEETAKAMLMAPLMAIVGMMSLLPSAISESLLLFYSLLTLLTISLGYAVVSKSKRRFLTVTVAHLLLAIIGLMLFARYIRTMDDCCGSGG